ncbi:excinuclease ABC subunit A [Catalinimonas alkaloidigena]|uniref:UvrABC system protein A n=1 Tax=Catalinimonas alkaloidigena TaxID=1075417 RepID=A0A1G9DY00_9BACT|nr:excinuclease ABC subunit UvrA [Catalinimonas alkaloidigena]SDK68728.1 excinuclease ABC subunit A [Catalinimonas alkaloidigena]
MQEEAVLTPSLDELDPKEFIIIKGAKVHNLKNLSVAFPRNKLVVVTGLSGSGKSSLVFDTLFAEGQRMYVESLSSYARQFLGRMEKPEVEYIRGVSPAIAIEQKVNTRNPRSTVGTSTEIYDYLKLLFARIGVTYSPISGEVVRKDTVTDVVDYLLSLPEGTRVMVLAPLQLKEGRTLEEELKILLQQGFTRIQVQGEVRFIEEVLEKSEALANEGLFMLIDRAVIKHGDEQAEEDLQFRLADSVQTAFYEGNGACRIEAPGLESGETIRDFSDRFEADGMQFEEPSVNLFTFNNPYGACRTCEGFGKVLGIDPDLVIPNKNLSVYEGAIAPWRSEKQRREWLEPLLKKGIEFDFPIHRQYNELTPEQQELLWTGNRYFSGLHEFFRYVETQLHKVQYRVMLSRYRGKTTCPDCRGSRLRKDASYVRINGKSITDLVLMPVSVLRPFFDALELPEHQQKVARRLLAEVQNRLRYLEDVGLGYLTLNRLTNTLSGGEYQRIKLSTSLGSALVGSMYILDEPSIGLHPRDTKRLIGVLETLRDLGNTVIVVEHEEEVMRAADQLIDIGPDAGVHGGELMFQGTVAEMSSALNSHTARYLHNIDRITVPARRREWRDYLEVQGARENNLKNLDVKFPLGVLTVVTGVSGSGKSTLIKKILYPALAKHLGDSVSEQTGRFDGLAGSLSEITRVEFVDQNPIGKSSRSNPVTYVKAYDYIRNLYAEQPLAKQRGYKPAFFSFNVDGGRCEVCQGEGEVKIEMQFMADIYLTCESCHGKRFKQEVLEVKYRDKDIAEILDLTVDQAVDFFAKESKVVDRLRPLKEVGLGYIGLGQSSNTLSGGEAQRVKLASFLGKGSGAGANDRILFIFDEPTTGLHFHDIHQLLKAINALIEQGHTVVIIEHNMDVIKSADWIIDLGPEGGDAGGNITFQGTPEEMVTTLADNHTARFLEEKL